MTRKAAKKTIEAERKPKASTRKPAMVGPKKLPK